MATPKKKLPVEEYEDGKLPSAYDLYFRDTANDIKKKNPKYSLQQLSIIVAERWNDLDPIYKAVYREKSELAKRNSLKSAEEQLKQNENSQEQTMNRQAVTNNPTNNTITTTITASQIEVQPDTQSDQEVTSAAEDDSLQKCIRKNCTNRAIWSPDWEEEYCSNECEVIHYHQVFNEWLLSDLDENKE